MATEKRLHSTIGQPNPEEKTTRDSDIPTVSYHPEFFTPGECAEIKTIFDELYENGALKSHSFKMFGKGCTQNRETCNLSNGCRYSYSGIDIPPLPIPEKLVPFVRRLGELAGEDFGDLQTLCVLNRYRDGKRDIGWHSDDERDLDQSHAIVSLSIGATRDFKMRPRQPPREMIKTFSLDGGSVLVMHPGTQERWQHCVPKRMAVKEVRYNLTLRKMIPRRA